LFFSLLRANATRAAGERVTLEVAIEGPGCYGSSHHEAASKFLGQRQPAAKYSATAPVFRMDGGDAIRFNARGTIWAFYLRAKPMKKQLLMMVLISLPAMSLPVMSWPAWAQTQLTPKGVTARTDNCAPIGRTANGQLVYSMKCENLPAPPPPPQAELKETAPPPAAEPEVKRSGLFGMSYEVKRPDQ